MKVLRDFLDLVLVVQPRVSVALENSAFERTHVESKMKVIGPVE